MLLFAFEAPSINSSRINIQMGMKDCEDFTVDPVCLFAEFIAQQRSGFTTWCLW